MTTALDRIQKLPLSFLNRDIESDLGKRWRIFAEELDEIRAVFESLRGVNSYSLQSGYTLDLIGGNVGQKREGRDDYRYKILLSVANAKRYARGDISSMNQIGEKLLLGSGVLLEIRERFLDISLIKFDATWKFDGSRKLSGSGKSPATIYVVFQGEVNVLQMQDDYAAMIDQIRSGGVRSIVVYDFIIESGLHLAPVPESGNLTFAFGNGAENDGVIRQPSLSDTGLQNEIARIRAKEKLTEGVMQCYAELRGSIASNSAINELAVFDESGNLIYLSSFPGKTRNTDSIVRFFPDGLTREGV